MSDTKPTFEPITITFPWDIWDAIWISIEDDDSLWSQHGDEMHAFSVALYGDDPEGGPDAE